VKVGDVLIVTKTPQMADGQWLILSDADWDALRPGALGQIFAKIEVYDLKVVTPATLTVEEIL